MSPVAATSTAAKKILIVDDQLSMAELWRIKFNQMGFEVDLVRDGEQALAAMQSGLYDVVLLDLYMPKKDGFSVLSEKSSTQNKDTPTFVLTSSIKDEDVVRAKQLGASRTFLKYQTSPRDVAAAVKAELAK